MALILLSALGGGSAYVEPANVVGLTAIPTRLLPSGTAAGTYIHSADVPDVMVEGTPLAVATLLGAGAAGGLGGVASCGFVDAATGAVTVAFGQAFTGLRLGVGSYRIIATGDPWAAGSVLVLTPTGPNLSGSQDGPVGAQAEFVVTDLANVAADGDFIVMVVSPPA